MGDLVKCVSAATEREIDRLVAEYPKTHYHDEAQFRRGELLFAMRDYPRAERAYAPWLDMETLMRENGIPLYALESKRPLACFDLIGFTLPYETLYTNAINILDLSAIPIRSADRDETHALRAEDECRQVLTQFPNSKFAPRAQQRLREVQEVIATALGGENVTTTVEGLERFGVNVRYPRELRGTPEQIASVAGSYTGQFLRRGGAGPAG